MSWYRVPPADILGKCPTMCALYFHWTSLVTCASNSAWQLRLCRLTVLMDVKPVNHFAVRMWTTWRQPNIFHVQMYDAATVSPFLCRPFECKLHVFLSSVTIRSISGVFLRQKANEIQNLLIRPSQLFGARHQQVAKRLFVVSIQLLVTPNAVPLFVHYWKMALFKICHGL